RKRRVHHHHVPNKFVVRTVVGSVVQHDQRVKQRHARDQQQLRRPQRHGYLRFANVLKYSMSAAMVASSYWGLAAICDSALLACGLRTYAANFSGAAAAQPASTGHGIPAFVPPSAPALWQRKQFCWAMGKP